MDGSHSSSLPCIKPPFPDPSKWGAIAAMQRTQPTASLNWAVPSENYYNSFALYPQYPQYPQMPENLDYASSDHFAEGGSGHYAEVGEEGEEEDGEYEEVLVMNEQWAGTFSKALQKMTQKVQKVRNNKKWTRVNEKLAKKDDTGKGKVKVMDKERDNDGDKDF
jgi:hypothetical protein